MEINKRNRTDLKSYFVKNSIPTESNFADLIDGMLNQNDDGVVKLPDNPLSIQASGDNASLQKVINFYRNFADSNPAWMLNLNPRSDPNKPETAKAGFSISDGQGNSRLFIDPDSGNIGIGTIDPSIPGMTRSLAVGRSAGGIYGIVQREAATEAWRMSLVTEGQERLSIKDNGNVGIGTTDPKGKLEVVGALAVNDGNGAAVKANFMASGSLTIGSIVKNYGGGANWNSNTAGLLLETQKNTEIAVHDSNTRLASLLYYEGDADNRITIGRDMGWGPISEVVMKGSLRLGGAITSPTAIQASSNHLQLRRETTETTGDKQLFLELYQDDPKIQVPTVYPSIRFHHNNRFWHRLEARPDGFHFKEGYLPNDGYINISAGYIIGKNPFDRNFRDNESNPSDSARVKEILSGRSDGTFIIGGPTPNYPYHLFFYWKAGGALYRTWLPFDPSKVEKF